MQGHATKPTTRNSRTERRSSYDELFLAMEEGKFRGDSSRHAWPTTYLYRHLQASYYHV